MKNAEFNKELDKFLISTKNVLSKKAVEYSDGKDRFYNLNKAHIIFSLIDNKNSRFFPTFAFGAKHFVSICDLIDGKLEMTKGNIDEKLGDYINYLLLLRAQMHEICEISSSNSSD